MLGGRRSSDQSYQTRVRDILHPFWGCRDMHYQIRKGTNTEYDAPTQSTTKAKKYAQGLEKKHLKAEAYEWDARERQEEREKRLEDK